MSSSIAPVVVLAAHRSGSSFVMSVLQTAGLQLGGLTPPAPDNPRGFFENTETLSANRELFALYERDWTCPPPFLEPGMVDERPFATAVESFDPSVQWGFKDPRTMFALAGWAQVVSGFRFVGVYRPTSALAASIRDRNGFSEKHALAIADAYNSRLADLHRALGFPIVNFHAPPKELIDGLETVCTRLDLAWNSEAASTVFDRQLVHHGTDQSLDTQADAYLQFQSSEVSETLDVVSSTAVVAANRSVSTEKAYELPRFLGPSFQARRRSAAASMFDTIRRGGRWVEIIPPGAASGPGLAGLGQPDTIITLSEGDDGGVTLGDESANRILATDVLDYLAPERVQAFFDSAARVSTPHSRLVVGGHIHTELDSSLREWADLEVSGSRDYPYAHSIDVIINAAALSGWHPAPTVVNDGPSTLVFSRSPAEIPHDHEPAPVLRSRLHAVRTELSETRSRFEGASKELSDTRSGLASASSDLLAAQAHLETSQERVDELSKTIHESAASLHETQGQLEASQALTQALAKERDRAQLQAEELQKQQQAAKRSLAETRAQLGSVTKMFQRLKARRSVRLMLGVARTARPLFSTVRYLKRRLASTAKDTAGTADSITPAPRQTAETTLSPIPSARRERALTRSLVAARSVNKVPISGQLVSIIILTRDGLSYLQRLFDGFANRTDYSDFEVIVVDNASTDGTIAFLDRSWRFPVTVIKNETNQSFSDSNNRGVEKAKGDLILFLNNDIDPINPGWLGAMVGALEDDSRRAAAGALLIYPRPETTPPEHAQPLTTQHRGIKFRYTDGTPKGFNLGHGEDPRDYAPDGIESVPGVTAACMLIRATVIDEVEGFTGGYVYGTEDVDLCLKIRQAGYDIVFVAGAVLFHHEFGTQDELGNPIKRINRTWNRTLFLERWGPMIANAIDSERFRSERFWSVASQPTVAITLTRDEESGGWGDYYTAHELGDSMEELGWRVIYAERFQDRWYELAEDVDLVISLLDSCDVRRLPASAFKIAWVRNWVNRWLGHPWFETFDLIAASSEISARLIKNASSQKPAIVPLATNPTRFRPQPSDITYESDYVFTGNHWGVNRELIDRLSVRPEEKFVIFGKGWEEVSRVQRYWRGHADYRDLPMIYSSAKIVLDDTAGPTLPYGAVNSRVFDALAAGALVITDNVVGAAELFDGLLPTYSSRGELRAQLDRYLDDEELRESTAQKLRSMVLERHTYPRLASELLGAAQRRQDQQTVRLKIGPPSWEVAEHWGDTHFARHFGRALRQLGFRSEIDVLSEWDSPASQSGEVVVHLRGLVPYVPKRGQVNVLWIISHPEDVPGSECDEFDLVLVASHLHAKRLSTETKTRVVPLLQATSNHVFGPREPNPELQTDVLFVGNSRGILRRSLAWAIDQGIRVDVYGSGWTDLIPSEFIRAEYFPNDRLAELYSSAKIVLNDHWDDMREAGFVSNRIFDALTCGTLVISDDVEGIEDMFGGAVLQYSDPASLKDLVERYVNDDEARTALTRAGEQRIRESHTFDQRATEFVSLVNPLLEERTRSFTPLRTDRNSRMLGAETPPSDHE